MPKLVKISKISTKKVLHIIFFRSVLAISFGSKNVLCNFFVVEFLKFSQLLADFFRAEKKLFFNDLKKILCKNKYLFVLKFSLVLVNFLRAEKNSSYNDLKKILCRTFLLLKFSQVLANFFRAKRNVFSKWPEKDSV